MLARVVCLLVCTTLFIVAQAHNGEHSSLRIPSADGTDPRGSGVEHIMFENSCGDKDGQERLRNGIALLHSFFYDEAVLAFTALEEDYRTTCPMAVWGRTMSYVHLLWEPVPNEKLGPSRASLLEALDLANNRKDTRDIEKDYILAALEFYADAADVDKYTDRIMRYYKAMEKLTKKYANDMETQIFFSLCEVVKGAVFEQGTDDPLFSARRAGKRLELILTDYPDHPGAQHYLTHAYDYPDLAELGRKYALHYAKTAPDVPHALHMSSHIFSRLGMWNDSIATNERGVHFAEEYVEKLHPGKGMWHEEKIHSTEFITYAQLQMGYVRIPRKKVQKAMDVDAIWPVDSETATQGLSHLPARIAFELRDWEFGATYDPHFYTLPVWKEMGFAKLFRLKVKTVSLVRLGRFKEAQVAFKLMKQEYRDVVKRGYLDNRPGYFKTWFDNLVVMAESWILVSTGDCELGLQKMKHIVESWDANTIEVSSFALVPYGEVYGDLLVFCGRLEEARKIYTHTLRRVTPGRFNLIFSLGQVSEQVGRPADAYQYYKELMNMCGNREVERKELAHAIEYVYTYDTIGLKIPEMMAMASTAVSDLSGRSSDYPTHALALTATAGVGAGVAMAVVLVVALVVMRKRQQQSRDSYDVLI